MSSADRFNNAVPSAGSARRESDRIPDGEYRLRVVSLFINPKNREHYYKMGFEVADGLLRGKYTEAFGAISERADWLRGALAVASGRDASNLPTWEDVFDEDAQRTGPIRSDVLGAVVEARITTRQGRTREFVNISVQTLVSAVGGSKTSVDTREEPEAAQSDEGDDGYHFWSKTLQRENISAREVVEHATNEGGEMKLWRDGWADWKRLADVPEIAAMLPKPEAKPKPPAPPLSKGDDAIVEIGSDADSIPF